MMEMTSGDRWPWRFNLSRIPKEAALCLTWQFTSFVGRLTAHPHLKEQSLFIYFCTWCLWKCHLAKAATLCCGFTGQMSIIHIESDILLLWTYYLMGYWGRIFILFAMVLKIQSPPYHSKDWMKDYYLKVQVKWVQDSKNTPLSLAIGMSNVRLLL